MVLASSFLQAGRARQGPVRTARATYAGRPLYAREKPPATAAAFVGNDPTGTLFAWRGWALHDVKTTVFGRFPLPDVFSISAAGPFRDQAPWVQPHKELDDRIGFYGRVQGNWRNIIRLNAFYFENRGDPLAFDGYQYGWDTDFINIGAVANLDEQTELMAQYMRGGTRMGPTFSGVTVLDIVFDSFYVLLSRRFGNHRLTVRFDDFQVIDNSFQFMDDNTEQGHAWTLAYGVLLKDRHRIMFEMLHVDSSRVNRPTYRPQTLSPQARETQLQASYRFSF